MYYVYAHINPETNQPFYIGKGTKERCRAKGKRSPAWKRYVSALEAKGLTYAIEIRHVCDSELKALRLEQTEIAAELDKGKALFNVQASKELIIDADVVADETYGVLATFVRSRRKRSKLTQVQFADRMGVGLRFLRELESGKPTLRMDVVNKVLYAFGCRLGPIKTEGSPQNFLDTEEVN